MLRRNGNSQGVGFALGILVVFLIAGVAVVRSNSQQNAPEILALAGPPLPGGTETSLSQAQASLVVPVYLPNSSLAQDSSVQDVWVRSAGLPEVLIDYKSGVRVTYRANDFAPDPVSFYRAQVADGIPGQIGSIDGVMAFVVSQDDQGDLGSVSMMINGTYVAVIGVGDFTDAQLTDVATSIVKASESTSTG